MKIFLLFLLTLSLYANSKEDLLNLYKNKKYENACNFGLANLKDNRRDEEFVSIYALSCLESDHINRLAIPITILKFSPEARANSAYFSVILMQKRLLYHALLDGYDLSSLNLPTTNFILSTVFDLYAEQAKNTKNDFYIFTDKNDNRISYKLYLEKHNKLNKIIIEKFYDKKLIQQHMYW
jgi:hypothetical protein